MRGAATAATRPRTAGSGPLEPHDRRFFEARFKHSFAEVRIHADGEASRSAAAFDARAYTLGNDIHFAAGQYQPDTFEGRRLLAHELAHVVQQPGRSGTGVPLILRQPQESATKPSPPAKADTLKTAGVDLADPVSSKTTQIIDAVLLRNRTLAPYIGGKLGGGFRISGDGRFKQEATDALFDGAYEKLYGSPAESYVMGFYDYTTSIVHVRPGATFGTALHEAIHSLASPNVYAGLQIAKNVSNDLVSVLTEGLTAFFTDRVLKDEGLPTFNDAYRGWKAKAEKLATALAPDGFELLAKFNFVNGNVYAIGKRLGLSDKEYAALKGGAMLEIFKLIEKQW